MKCVGTFLNPTLVLSTNPAMIRKGRMLGTPESYVAVVLIRTMVIFRASHRGKMSPLQGGPGIGFRVARTFQSGTVSDSGKGSK